MDYTYNTFVDSIFNDYHCRYQRIAEILNMNTNLSPNDFYLSLHERYPRIRSVFSPYNFKFAINVEHMATLSEELIDFDYLTRKTNTIAVDTNHLAKMRNADVSWEMIKSDLDGSKYGYIEHLFFRVWNLSWSQESSYHIFLERISNTTIRTHPLFRDRKQIDFEVLNEFCNSAIESRWPNFEQHIDRFTALALRSPTINNESTYRSALVDYLMNINP